MPRFIHISSYDNATDTEPVTEWLNVSLIQSVYAEIEGGSFGGLTTIIMLGGWGTDSVRMIRTKETPESFFQRMNELILGW